MSEQKPIRPLKSFPSSDSFDRTDVLPVLSAVHVIPSTSKSWLVRKSGKNELSRYFRKKSSAVNFAEDLSSSTSSSLIIHNKNGTVVIREGSSNRQKSE
jgi:hypothetical protein